MNVSDRFPKLEPQKRVRRARYICDALRDMISKGDLKPGDKLPTEEELCKHFEVSRTTLREAIQMLRFSGLLRVSPGRGSYVQKPDFTSLMGDIVLYSKTMGEVDNEARRFLLQILEHAVLVSGDVSLEKRRALFDYIVHRQDSPEAAAEKERQWFVTMADMIQNRMVTMVVNIMIEIQKEVRSKALEDPDEVMRTIQTQIRLNSTIVDGELDVAQRVLRSYFGTIQPLKKQGVAESR